MDTFSFKMADSLACFLLLLSCLFSLFLFLVHSHKRLFFSSLIIANFLRNVLWNHVINELLLHSVQTSQIMLANLTNCYIHVVMTYTVTNSDIVAWIAYLYFYLITFSFNCFD